MVQLIVGKKGKGKTKYLLDKVNTAIQDAHGSIVYLDKSSKHMYELNNKIRLIDVSAFPLRNSDEFIGFICGILSQDHDLEQMYLDSFLRLARLEGRENEIDGCVKQLEEISRIFGADFVLSVSLDKEELSAELQEKIILAL
ncbi:MAG TPA: twitching motility protein PilT [Candidatus Scatomonas pullistercoris]|uniref:Twitching motility protein PilT n=1 Tax=Candidatus Scatomonas pullistercoris TaxID=2840920 RepID=A0A9D1P240_9FIRM|nr:twitching motility protein PilT [Candidatus Scatomonas pullistercoris]